MPLEPDHILNFLENSTNDRFNSELLDLLIKRINRLCFEECERDRIACTLTPLCTRRFLLRLRIKNDLTIDALPKFCYSVHKNIVLRYFRRKTIVYKPFDAYLYLIDFLDIFFHGDYRKLNKYISIKSNWDDALKIFDERIQNGQDFQYYITENHMIFKFKEKIHVIFFKEKYVLCNAKRENITSLELLYGLCELYRRLYFPEFKVNFVPSKHVEIIAAIPADVMAKIKNEPNINDNSNLDQYFWEVFPQDLDALMQICKEIQLQMNVFDYLEIRLHINLETNNLIEKKKKLPLRYRDLRLIFNFVYRLFNDFFTFWLE